MQISLILSIEFKYAGMRMRTFLMQIMEWNIPPIFIKVIIIDKIYSTNFLFSLNIFISPRFWTSSITPPSLFFYGAGISLSEKSGNEPSAISTKTYSYIRIIFCCPVDKIWMLFVPYYVFFMFLNMLENVYKFHHI